MSQVMGLIILQGILLFGIIGNSWASGPFVDNNDGTVTDTVSALMWQKSDDDVERTWDNAVAYCDSLDFAGFTDWTLPKIHMLENLIDSSFSPTINPVFSVKPSYYWSSSESRTSVKSAKYVNFFYGNTYAFSKDNTYYNICVRDVSLSIRDPLSASLDFATSSEKEPFHVEFSSRITGGMEPYFYEWDFGDGDFSSRSNPGHIFQKKGKYKVVLTVSDNDGTIAVVERDMGLPLIIEPDEVAQEREKVSETPTVQKTQTPGIAVADPKPASTSEAPENLVSPEVIALDEKDVQPTPPVAEGIKPELEEAAQSQKNGDLSKKSEAVNKLAGGVAIVSTDSSELYKKKEILIEPLKEEAPITAFSGIGEVEGQKETTAEMADKVVEGEDFKEKSDSQLTALPEKDSKSEALKAEVSAPVQEFKEDIAVAGLKRKQDTETLAPETLVTETLLSPASDKAGEAIKGEKGVFSVLASTKSEPAQAASGGNGLLAYSFMNALNGDADWNKDGNITAQELRGYLGFAIDNLSKSRQKAEITVSKGDFPLCAAGGVTHIMAIGVDSYNEETSKPLIFAGDSADSVAQVISEKCSSWKKLVLTGQDTVRTNIFRAIVKMGRGMTSADNFIFYFAGSSRASEKGLALLTYDTLPELRDLTGIFLEDVKQVLENVPAANIIMLFEVGPYAQQ